MSQIDTTEIWSLLIFSALVFLPLGVLISGAVKRVLYRRVARGAVRRKVRHYHALQDYLEEKTLEEEEKA